VPWWQLGQHQGCGTHREHCCSCRRRPQTPASNPAAANLKLAWGVVGRWRPEVRTMVFSTLDCSSRTLHFVDRMGGTGTSTSRACKFAKCHRKCAVGNQCMHSITSDSISQGSDSCLICILLRSAVCCAAGAIQQLLHDGTSGIAAYALSVVSSRNNQGHWSMSLQPGAYD
jgi:hypothetical protein